jgi:hypothetical protein
MSLMNEGLTSEVKLATGEHLVRRYFLGGVLVRCVYSTRTLDLLLASREHSLVVLRRGGDPKRWSTVLIMVYGAGQLGEFGPQRPSSVEVCCVLLTQVSPLNLWGPCFIKYTERVLFDTWIEDQAYFRGLKDGYSDLSPMSVEVPLDVQVSSLNVD